MKKINFKRLLAFVLVLATISVNELPLVAADTLPAEQSENVQDREDPQQEEPSETAMPEGGPPESKEDSAIPKDNFSAPNEDSSEKKDESSEENENSPKDEELPDEEEHDTEDTSDSYEGTYIITIHYFFKDNKTMAARPYIESVPAGEAVSKSIKSPDVMGYQPLVAEQSINITAMDRDMDYDIYYVPKNNTPYTVNHYQENIDRDGYTLTGVGHLSGMTNATVTASPQPYTGFTPPDVMPSAQINHDGSTTLDVYYTRNQYTMHFDTGEGGNYIEPVTAAFDQPLTPPPDPVRPGYRFAGWGSYGFPSRMPIGDIMMKAEWSVEGNVSYTLVYWLESIDENGTYDYVGAVQENAPTESTPVIPQSPPTGIRFPIDETHFTLNEAKTNAKKPDKINGTGSTIVNVYYDRKSYSISFHFNDAKYTLKADGTVYDTSPYVLTAKYGTYIADKWPADAPKLRSGQSGDGAFTGWTSPSLSFSTVQYFLDNIHVTRDNLNAGWSYGTKNMNVTYLFEDLTGGGETADYEQFLNIASGTRQWNAKQFIGFTPLNDVVNIAGSNTAEFHYKRNTYQITFYSSGTIDRNVSGIKYEAPLLEQVYTPPTPASLPGYTFGGWYTSPQAFEGSKYDFTGKIMPAKNLILHAKWVKPAYTVTFHPNNGSADFTQRVILQENAAEPDTPTRPGYQFVGWYKTGSSFRYIFPPVTGDTTLNARWIPVDTVSYDVIYKIGTSENSMEHSRASYTGKTVGTKVTASAIAIPGMLPDAANKTITLTADENHVIFYYAPFTSAVYTVKYLESGTQRQLRPDKQVNTRASEVTENYVSISGYYPDRYQQTLLLSPIEEENVLVFTYTKNSDAVYKVEHYLEQTDGKYHHDASDTETFTAPVGSVQSAAPKTFENYHYNSKISLPKDVVLANNETVLRLYYSLTRYTVKYLADQHGSLQGESVFQDIRHGTPYKTGAPAPVPKPAPGYRFTEWEPALPASDTSVTADAVYTARFALDPEKWSTVSYHPNGGTGTMENDTVLNGTGYKIRPHSFTRANHQFVGWNTAPDANGARFSREDHMTVTGNITLYAEWVPDTQYAVTYIANGGTGHMADPHGFYYRNDPVAVLQNTYVRAGYHFTKWTTKEDGTGTSYGPADTFHITENTALYAQWEKDLSQWVTIQFDKNHPQADGHMVSREVLAANPFAIPERGYELKHHDFHGWNSQKDGGGKSIADKEVFIPEVKFPSQKTITLYAQWKEHKKYTVTYHSNNPLNQTVKDTVSYYEGSMIRLHPSDTFDYPHHTFMYWTRAMPNDDAYIAGESFTIDKDMNFYAQWKTDPEFRVDYKDPYSKDTWSDPNTYNIRPTGSDLVTVKDSMFQRHGYDFAGWDVEFKDRPGVSHAALPGNVLRGVTSDTTLYAQWKPHIYQITYELQGGQVHGANPSEYDIETATFTLMNPERPGYTFLGWSGTDINTTLPSDKVTVVKGSTGDRLYQAHWKKDPAQWSKIIFKTSDPSKGTLAGTQSFEGIKGYPTSQVSRPEYRPKSGFKFLNWDPTMPDIFPDTDLIIFANWEELPIEPPSESVDKPKPKPPVKSVPKTPQGPKTIARPKPKVPATSTPESALNFGTANIARKNTPKTGDNNHVFFWMTLVVFSGGIILALNYKKKNQQI